MAATSKKSTLAKRRESAAYKVFKYFNYLFLWLVAACCVLPMVHILALSLSQRTFSDAGLVGLWPKGFTFAAYEYVFQNQMFFITVKNSVLRVLGGVTLTVFVNILLAFPMSKDKKEFKGRPFFLAVIVFTMFFSGGMVPTFLLMKQLKLYDTLWVYIIPGAVNTYYALLMMNFFRQLPREIEEAAKVDGCDYFGVLLRIVLPLSTPVLATIVLYAFVGHWNSWFDGKLYSATSMNYPLQTMLYDMLQTLVSGSMSQAEALEKLGGTSVSSAQIFITMLPIMAAYPFLQKYFVNGIVLGSVKG